jgi:hypothetical protein
VGWFWVCELVGCGNGGVLIVDLRCVGSPLPAIQKNQNLTPLLKFNLSNDIQIWISDGVNYRVDSCFCENVCLFAWVYSTIARMFVSLLLNKLPSRHTLLNTYNTPTRPKQHKQPATRKTPLKQRGKNAMPKSSFSPQRPQTPSINGNGETGNEKRGSEKIL